MEIVIVAVLAFILGVAAEKARVEARKELKKMRAEANKPVAPAPVAKKAPAKKAVAKKAPAKKAVKKAAPKKK